MIKVIPKLWVFTTACYMVDKRKHIPPTINFANLDNVVDSAYIADYDQEVIFAFQGTKNNRAWISDFDILPLRGDLMPKSGSWGRGTIADGFYEGWEDFKDPISNYIKENCKGKKIYCTGHSRGGALATLCARHIAKNLKLPCSCVSFASPAQGTKVYRDELDLLPLNHTRVTYGYDIVPKMPPKELGFYHGGKEIYLPNPNWIDKFRPSRRFEDHHPKNYQKAILKYFKDDALSCEFINQYSF